MGADAGDPPIDDVARPLAEDVPPSAFARPEPPDDDDDNDSPPGCELILDTEGACGIACDTDAVLGKYVPLGTCAMFACELSNGDTLQIGGCHL